MSVKVIESEEVGLVTDWAVPRRPLQARRTALPCNTPNHDGAMPADIDSLLADEQAIKHPAAPEDIVGTVLFLTGDDAEFVTAKFIAADGGYTRHY